MKTTFMDEINVLRLFDNPFNSSPLIYPFDLSLDILSSWNLDSALKNIFFILT